MAKSPSVILFEGVALDFAERDETAGQLIPDAQINEKYVRGAMVLPPAGKVGHRVHAVTPKPLFGSFQRGRKHAGGCSGSRHQA